MNKSILITLILMALPAFAEEIVEAAINRKANVQQGRVLLDSDSNETGAITMHSHPTAYKFARMDKDCAAHLQATTGPDAPKQQRAPRELVECLQRLIRPPPEPLVIPEPYGEIVPIELQVGRDISIGINP